MRLVSFFNTRKPIRVEGFAKTDLGRTRDHNEDRFLVADLTKKSASLLPEVRRHDIGPRGTLLVVADGMGGAAAGELAREMGAGTIYAHPLKTRNTEGEGTPQRFSYRLKKAGVGAETPLVTPTKGRPRRG